MVADNNIHQEGLWKIAESVGAREGRLDIGVASAGLLKEQVDMLTHPGEEFKEVNCFIIYHFGRAEYDPRSLL